MFLLTVAVAGIAYFWARAKFLPRVQLDKELRWDYDYIEVGDSQDTGYSIFDNHEALTLQYDSNNWINGSSSSYSIGGRSSVGARSPVDETQSLWDNNNV